MTRAFNPDIIAMKKRTRTRLLHSKDTLIFYFEAESIPSLRASVNTYLRLVKAMRIVRGVLEEAGM